MKIYKIEFEYGRYFAKRKILFWWINIGHMHDGEIMGFRTYLEASKYIRLKHLDNHGNTKFRIER